MSLQWIVYCHYSVTVNWLILIQTDLIIFLPELIIVERTEGTLNKTEVKYVCVTCYSIWSVESCGLCPLMWIEMYFEFLPQRSHKFRTDGQSGVVASSLCVIYGVFTSPRPNQNLIPRYRTNFTQEAKRFWITVQANYIPFDLYYMISNKTTSFKYSVFNVLIILIVLSLILI